MADTTPTRPEMNVISKHGNESLVQQDSRPSTPRNFWHSFRLFEWRFEEYGFKYIYIILIIYSLVILSLDLMFDLRAKVYLPYWNLVLLNHDLTNWILISFAVSLALI